LKNLFRFLLINIHWLLFGLLVYLSVLLIVNNHQFQRSRYLEITQEITGHVHTITKDISSYFSLKRDNEALHARLAQLETERYYLTAPDTLFSDSLFPADDFPTYRFIPARVVNNSVSLHENYLTLNKGSNDGIHADMGILSVNGSVVGVVTKTSPHFSTAISLLNTQYKPNGKIKRNEYFGPLVWDGKDTQFLRLTEIPRHADFEEGDTIITSGYSTVFPKGIPIGVVTGAEKQRDDNYNALRVRLFTDFHHLSEVLIVDNRLQEEQRALETISLKTAH
jgi:rod shape-determining protein MreC